MVDFRSSCEQISIMKDCLRLLLIKRLLDVCSKRLKIMQMKTMKMQFMAFHRLFHYLALRYKDTFYNFYHLIFRIMELESFWFNVLKSLQTSQSSKLLRNCLAKILRLNLDYLSMNECCIFQIKLQGQHWMHWSESFVYFYI